MFVVVYFIFYSVSLNYLNDLSVFDKKQIHFGSKQIVDGFLFDSTFEPAVSIVSRSLIACNWYVAASLPQTLLVCRADQLLLLFQK